MPKRQALTTLSGGERHRLRLAIEMGSEAAVIVLEHNLDVVSRADWVIDLGPGAGAQGGRVVYRGTPAALAAEPGDSLTGRHLAKRVASTAGVGLPT